MHTAVNACPKPGSAVMSDALARTGAMVKAGVNQVVRDTFSVQNGVTTLGTAAVTKSASGMGVGQALSALVSFVKGTSSYMDSYWRSR